MGAKLTRGLSILMAKLSNTVSLSPLPFLFVPGERWAIGNGWRECGIVLLSGMRTGMKASAGAGTTAALRERAARVVC